MPTNNFYRDYRVKVYGKIDNRTINQLVGLPWLSSQFDTILLGKILEKANNTRLDKITLKFRRGIKIVIYPR